MILFLSVTVPEMEDLRKIVADLKELGDKVGIANINYITLCSVFRKMLYNKCIFTSLIIADFEVTS